MLSFRIICHYCGHDSHCPVPLGIKDKAQSYDCGNCNAHLGEFINSE
ncbi:MAG: hypothetical protein OEM18_07000 [Nitrosopumilus sp.]|nr:hypothetical protein [Nitrosopumilus sp.]